jgi:hypothetical protein
MGKSPFNSEIKVLLFSWIVLFLLMLLVSNFLLNLNTALASPDDDLNALIKKIQVNSQRSYDEIDSVTFSGHSKTYVYFSYSPFEIKLIPVMEEYYFDGFWMKPDSLRIVVKALRTVEPDTQKIRYGGMIPLPNPFQFIYDPSALGLQRAMRDSHEVNVWPLYPFASGADSVYHYHKINEIGFGENKILTIKVTPTNSAMPAVSGRFLIDADKHVVVGSDVIFNEAASFTRASVQRDKRRFSLSIGGSENHKVKTKKALLYETYWLPTIVEEEFEIRLLGVKAKVYRKIEFNSYFVNPGQADSVDIQNEKIVYKIDPGIEKKVFADLEYPNRLSKEEQEQIIKKIEDKFSSTKLLKEIIESDNVAKEAIKIGWEQTVGPYFGMAQKVGKFFVFNRVEGLRLNYGFNLSNFLLNHSVVSLNGGYGFKDKRWKGDAALVLFLNHQKNLFFEGNFYQKIDYEEDPRLISTERNSFTSLLYKGDYRDYYYKRGVNFGIGVRATENLVFKITFVSQKEENAANHTSFSLFKYKRPFRFNPEIVEGKFNGIQASLLYQIYKFDFDLFAEYTDQNYFHSDFSYTVIKTNLQKRYRLTEYSDLNIFTSGAASSGNLTPQRWFDFGGKTFMNYHGNLRGIDYKAFTGDRMINSTVEYSIVGSEFYNLGLKVGFVKALKLHLWSGIGWSSLSEKSKQFASDIDTPTRTTDGIYHEFGIGIGDRFNILRVDLVRNSISKNRVLVSLNVLR